MTDLAADRPLRLWPGVVIVALQLFALYGPGYFAPTSMVAFFGVMGSFTVGTLLLLIWWLFFSRARWFDRFGGLALLIVVHAAAFLLAHESAKVPAMVLAIPWVCAAFVASLFLGKRAATVIAVLVASLGWTLVRTEGVSGSMDFDFAWRWSATYEERFMASDASAVPSDPVVEPIEVDSGAAVEESAAWPGFRGSGRDNVIAGVMIDQDWSRNPPEEIWRRQVGPGWSSFALVDNRLCTQEQRDEDEVVVCYDAANGEPIWLHAYAARFWESMAGAGPRATPTYHDGRLYALGATGVLNCLDASTGTLVWTRNIADDSGARVPDWGFASSPLVVDDMAIVHAAGAPEGRAVIAYDLTTGEPRWFGESSGASYSSPHLTTIDDVRQIVMLTAEGAFGLEAEKGDLLWKHEWPMSSGESRVLQPWFLDGGGEFLIGTSVGYGTRKVNVSSDASGTWTVDEEWTSRGLKPYYNDLVVHRGTAFGFDGGILAAIDVETGDRAWKGGRYGNGQVLLLPDQDLLLVVSERGELALVRASPEGFEEVAKMQVLSGKTWNHPIVAGGIIYIRNAEEAAAYRLPT